MKVLINLMNIVALLIIITVHIIINYFIVSYFIFYVAYTLDDVTDTKEI